MNLLASLRGTGDRVRQEGTELPRLPAPGSLQRLLVGTKQCPQPCPCPGNTNSPGTLQLVRNHMDSQSPQPRARRSLGGRGGPVLHFGIVWALGRSQPAQPTLPGCAWPADTVQLGWVPLCDNPITASLGFAVQSASNNDGALPAPRLFHLTPRVCNGQTGLAARLWEWAWPLQASPATLGTAPDPFATQLREGGRQRVAESPRSHRSGGESPTAGGMWLPPASLS